MRCVWAAREVRTSRLPGQSIDVEAFHRPGGPAKWSPYAGCISMVGVLILSVTAVIVWLRSRRRPDARI